MLRFLIDTIEFVYNNYITISILIGASAFFVFNSKQLYMEISFNRLLRMKQKFLRNSTVVQSKSKKVRRVAYIASPMILLIIFLSVTFANPTVFDQHITYLNTEEDILSVRQNFESKFYSNPLAQDEQVLPTSRTLRQTTTTTSELYEGIDFVAKDEMFIYVLTNDAIYINNYVDYEELTLEHVIELPHGECETERFKPEGLVVEGSRLSLIGQQSVNACDGEQVQAFHQREHKTFVFTYDRFNDFLVMDQYEIDGILSHMHYANNNLTLSVNQYIPYESTQENLKSITPKININNTVHSSSFENIRYIEGTNPNTLVSAYVLRLDRAEFTRETILTDYNHHILIRNNALYYVTDSYEFHPVSDLFESRDPVRNIRTVLTKINIQSSRVQYYRSTIIEGVVPFDGAMTIHSNNVIILTEKKEGSSDYLLHRLDRYLGKTHDLKLIDKTHLESVVFYNNHAYFLYDNQKLEVYYIADSERFYRQHTIENIRLSRNMTAFNEGLALGTNYVHSNQIDVQLIDTSVPAFPKINHNFRIDLTQYQYSLVPSRLRMVEIMSVPEHNLINIPLYVIGDSTALGVNAHHILYLEEIEGSVSIEGVLTLPPYIYGTQPFGYRTLVHDETLYHITTRGIGLTTFDDLETLIAFIDFE